MKAAVYKKYGPPEVVSIQEVPKPVPKDNEILVRIKATTVTAGDWRFRRADPVFVRLFNGFFRPKKVKILGFEAAGDVEEVGAKVTLFKPGDKVFSYTGFGFGAHAEYICIPETGKPDKDGVVLPLPDSMSYEEGAAVTSAGITAVSLIKKAGMPKGKKILVYGASGAMGVAIIQILKYLDCEVTGVCSTANLELVKDLGADQVIDYKKENFSEGGKTYDIVLDAVNKADGAKCKAVLVKGGKFLTSHTDLKSSPEDFEYLKKLIDKGRYKAVIDRTYPLDEIVEAHRYVESWRKKGSVVINIAPA